MIRTTVEPLPSAAQMPREARSTLAGRCPLEPTLTAPLVARSLFARRACDRYGTCNYSRTAKRTRAAVAKGSYTSSTNGLQKVSRWISSVTRRGRQRNLLKIAVETGFHSLRRRKLVRTPDGVTWPSRDDARPLAPRCQSSSNLRRLPTVRNTFFELVEPNLWNRRARCVSTPPALASLG